ncbi:hypothetical protein KXD93_26425 [Mucilaginibacter sp. BJC16-A38]|uniref:hypothetical protein n=1 Tax=Mucilaginibacter phenanthrenivorans TaxID=1234842 RepID=UPI0021575D01|nr:hypothetical protein [Mucilaginibacter phenanthrenivorans]MCR8561217.1 hypothetical protein [Mucilaginibacter phenanthrenivorans]
MKSIPSTAEILAFKMLGRNVNRQWIDWAYSMLEAGFETENLIILAGEVEPYNQFELQSLADKVLKELDLKWDDREQVIRNYACYLVGQALDGKLQTLNVLSTLTEVCIDDGYESDLYDFFSLYYAYDDLLYSENQWYWAGATRENIDAMIRQYFVDWKAKCG